jgi:hypothetical protein
MVPLLQVVEHDIDGALKRDNNHIEQEVEDKILNTNTVKTRHDSFVIVHPN